MCMIHYVSERKFFQGGIFYIRLNQVFQLDTLLKKLFNEAIKCFKLSPEQKIEINENIERDTFVIDFLFNFFNLKLDK